VLSGVSDDNNTEDEGEGRPSKSARKRAAHDAQDLGEALVGLKDADLDALALPEALDEALRAARRITSRVALARQRQYIGRLMRTMDLEPIRAALTAGSARAAADTERFKRLEHWRERLIDEGDAALAELANWHPDIDRPALARLVASARSERSERTQRSSGPASRELFRALRALFATMP
jgi:ribosome-associated protein